MHRDQLYSFEAPITRPTPLTKASAALSATALTDSSNFEPLWSQSSGGFGAPTDKPEPKSMAIAEAVMTNERGKTITTKYHTETMEKLWKEKQYELGDHQQLDIVGDVLNATHVGLVSTVLGIPLAQSKKAGGQGHGLISVLGDVFEHAFGNSHPTSLNANVRDDTHWLANSIASLFGSSAEWKQGELGRSTLPKLAEAGAYAKAAAWQDVLPTSALILITLSLLCAQTVEFSLDDKAAIEAAQNAAEAGLSEVHKLTQEATRLNMNITLATRATDKITKNGAEAAEGQVVVVDLAEAQNEDLHSPLTFKLDRNESAYWMEKVDPEVELAVKVTTICNTVVTSIMGRTPKIERGAWAIGSAKQDSLRYWQCAVHEY